MSKQNEFNVDMERYLDRSVKPSPTQKTKQVKNEATVNDLIPDIDEDPTKIHIIEKDSKTKIVFNEYKKKILSFLKKEEKQIEDIDIDESGNIKEEIEEIEEEIIKETKEAISFSKRFKAFFTRFFSSEVKEEDYQETVEVQQSLDEVQDEIKEEIEEELEDEEIEEELAQRRKFSSWIRSIFGKKEDPTIENQDPPIKKVVLYKAKLENDTKLALMIADKYLKQLPTGAMHTFEKSGDRKVFLDTLRKLKIR